MNNGVGLALLTLLAGTAAGFSYSVRSTLRHKRLADENLDPGPHLNKLWFALVGCPMLLTLPAFLRVADLADERNWRSVALWFGVYAVTSWLTQQALTKPS